ncbi:hypothetical protein BDZ89DRAFT_1067943, partial [Hymenopellis radicata]
MDDFSYAMPPPYYSQPMAPWIPMEVYPVDAAHALENRSLPRDFMSFPPTQLDPSHAMNLYPSLPISAERTLAYHPFPQDLPSFPPTNGLPAADPPNIERVESDSQSEAEAVESDPDSESEPEDHPLPADAARWISMSPTQFDREYPGGNPFVIEELSLDSEEDPESASYVELDGARALNRIFVIFNAVEWALFPYTSKDIYREIIWGILADLLKDGKVWLWVDGDEEQCADLHQDAESLEYVKRKLSCSLALRLRKPRSPTWTSLWKRVSKASFAMRASAITWATFTSVPVREAGWVRGRADWTRCKLFFTAYMWHSGVLYDLGILNLLEDESRHSYLEVAFKDTLRCHGHSCFSSFPKYSKEPQKLLLYMLSFLYSTPLAGKDVSMILFKDEFSCQQCAKLKELYIATPGHIPPLSLLVLNDLRSGFEIDTAAWLRILVLSVSRGMISAAILTNMDDEIEMNPDGTDEFFDFDYQPWVNRIPNTSLRHSRDSVVRCSESEWREAELAVRRANRHELVPTCQWDSMDIGLGVRITAIYLLMSEQSSWKLTPRKYRNACDEDWIDISNGPAQYPIHIAASVEAFCDATSPWPTTEASDFSTHTCCEFSWDKHSLNLRRCYAAAYLLLHPESQHVPLLKPLSRPVFPANRYHWCNRLSDKELGRDEDCFRECVKCQELPEAEPLATSNEVMHIPVSNGSLSLERSLPDADVLDLDNPTADIPPAELDDADDIVPTAVIVPPAFAISQIPSESGRPREPALSKDVILPKLKDHFAKLLAQYEIPIQYTNLGAPQLPWCTLPELLRNRRLEIAGWPEDLPLPDATGKHNAKGIMGLTAKEARRLHEALPGISFRRMDKARARPRESEDDIGNRLTKKMKGKGKAPAEGEWKFRLSEVQTVIRGIHVEKS